MERSPIPVLTVQTAPYEDQRPTGGGGLRRPTALFESQRNYLPNFVQSLLSSVDLRDRQGCTMVVGSDGRYFSRTAIEVVVQMAAANGVSKSALLTLPQGQNFPISSLPDSSRGTGEGGRLEELYFSRCPRVGGSVDGVTAPAVPLLFSRLILRRREAKELKHSGKCGRVKNKYMGSEGVGQASPAQGVLEIIRGVVGGRGVQRFAHNLGKIMVVFYWSLTNK